MGLYIFICHTGDDDSVVAARLEQQFDDDLDALEAAEDLAENCHVDVWTGERLVAQIKKGNEPFTVKDAHAG